MLIKRDSMIEPYLVCTCGFVPIIDYVLAGHRLTEFLIEHCPTCYAPYFIPEVVNVHLVLDDTSPIQYIQLFNQLQPNI